MIFVNFGTLLLDFISKMASRKERKSEFEVPIAATTISMVVTALKRLIAVCFVKVSKNRNVLREVFVCTKNEQKYLCISALAL